MKYRYDPNITRSTCRYETNPPSYNRPIMITIGQKDKHWKMNFAHELGHALSSKWKHKLVKDDTPHETMRSELLAWRFAKSFCKAKFWDNKQAIRCLTDYAICMGFKIDFSKIKIIPINTNRYLIDELRR